ncbi:MAG: helix-turn-helix domain-containing protein [Halanaerobiales bacterium]
MTTEKILKEEIQKTREQLPFSLTVPILAELMGISKRKVYQLLTNGEIPGAKKLMGQWRVPRDRFLSWWYGGGDQDS